MLAVHYKLLLKELKRGTYKTVLQIVSRGQSTQLLVSLPLREAREKLQ